MIKDLDELGQIVHALAIEKGWWSKILPTTHPRGDIASRDMGEILMLAVSELGEAMEEVRKPDFDPKTIYYMLPPESAPKTNGKVLYRPGMVGLPNTPEGFPIELADCVIRLMDTCCALDVEIHDRYSTAKLALGSFVPNWPPGRFLMSAVSDLGGAFTIEREGRRLGLSGRIADCIAMIDRISEIYGFDLEAAIWLKHEYNKTRPFRHGGKRS
jgi:hypothetical protein